MFNSITTTINFALFFIVIIKFSTLSNKLKSIERCKLGCGISNRPEAKIVGGIETLPNEFPWQVGVTKRGKNGKPSCGGTLITNQYVLTAGHCIHTDGVSDVFVFLGVHDWQEKIDLIPSIKLILHPEFELENYINDIALIKMKEQIEFSRNAKPPCFPRPGQNYTGRIATVSGWGKIAEDSLIIPDKLRKVDVSILPIERCKEAYGHYLVYSSSMCAGYMKGEKDSCKGDSGGPLVIREENGRWYIIGIISHGDGCARPYFPGVYVRLEYYYDWIDENTNGSKFCGH